MRVKILWGVHINQPDYCEELLSTHESHFEAIKLQASKLGYGKFRIAIIDDKKPDFIGTIINKRKAGSKAAS